jgi:hypothetical protein
MNQPDLFQKAHSPHTQSKSRRVSPEVAELGRILANLCHKPPHAVINGSVDTVRAWVAVQQKGLGVLKNPRSTPTDLTTAIAAFKRFHDAL